MAKAATQTVAPARAKTTVAVTYKPLEHVKMVTNEKGQIVPGPISYDPPVIIWNKIKFHANVPVELDPKNRAHGYPVPLATETIGPEGETRLRIKEMWASMIDLAKDNPSFQVEGFPRAKQKTSKRVVPPPGAEWADTHEDEIDQEVEEAA